MRSVGADIDAVPAVAPAAPVADDGLGLGESLFVELDDLGVEGVTDEVFFVAGTVTEVVEPGFADVSSVGILCFGDAITVSC